MSSFQFGSDERNTVVPGDRAKARWFDDPKWRKGVIFEGVNGKLAMVFPLDGKSTVGYLEDADAVYRIPTLKQRLRNNKKIEGLFWLTALIGVGIVIWSRVLQSLVS